VKAQDVCSWGDDLLVVGAHGAPTTEPQSPYASEILRVRLGEADKGASVSTTHRIEDAHFDCITCHGNRAYVTDQVNHRILVFDPRSLACVDAIQGFDFPHGIDIGRGVLAVTNYGSNTLVIRSAPGVHAY
jgi:hypothetical protein